MDAVTDFTAWETVQPHHT